MSTFKRDIETGTEIVLIEHLERYIHETNLRPVLSCDLNVPSTVGHRNASGFVLSHILIRWPKAKDLKYNGDTFTIVSRHPIYGHVDSKRTYRILQKAQPRIIYTTN